MSPTSYRTAPPRMLMVTTGRRAVNDLHRFPSGTLTARSLTRRTQRRKVLRCRKDGEGRERGLLLLHIHEMIDERGLQGAVPQHDRSRLPRLVAAIGQSGIRKLHFPATVHGFLVGRVVCAALIESAGPEYVHRQEQPPGGDSRVPHHGSLLQLVVRLQAQEFEQ